MRAFVTAKVGVFLVISSVLAAWMLLAAQSAQAHVYNTASTPSCSSLPTADGFFGTTGSPTATIAITAASNGNTGTTDAEEGTTTANSGNPRYRYAKITIPALAAGELRVFDTRTPTTGADSPVSAAALCRRGSRIASFGKSYHSGRHNTADTTATPAHTTDDEHEVFQIRVPVSPGDEEYIVVIDPEGTPSTGETPLAVQIAATFHGAIESTSPLLGRQGALDAGEVESRTILITAPGLLTLETTGSTDTVGTFGDNPEVESGGSDGNFKMVLPVESGTTGVSLQVEGQTPSTEGSYTLNMDFEVAMSTPVPAAQIEAPTQITVATGMAATSWPANTDIPDDDTTLQIDGSADADYFVFSSNANGFLTIEATDATGETQHSDTAGTLYGPDGQIATASSGGGGNHFKFRVPVDTMSYLVKVTGTTGHYNLSFAFDATTDQVVSQISALPSGAAACPTDFAGYTNLSNQICARGARLQQERDLYQLNIVESGALYVHTTGTTDTFGTLYGPDGGRIATDDNNGQGDNFRIATQVNPGLHIVEVRGQNPDTQGAYGLVTNFVTGAEVDTPTPPVDPVDPPPTIDPDPAGVLEEPPSGGVRSGIGLIRGWVCQDAGEGVQISITNTDSGAQATTFTAPYGSDRGDVNVSEHCADRIVNGVGFAVQYNYNLLPAGTYTIQAFVGRERVGLTPGGQTNTFTVARISDAEFLARVPSSSRVLVEDFPVRGTTTILEFDLSSQNFEIVGTQ